MPFMDPAFAVAVCRYDLSGGPIKLAVPVSQAYTSVSFYTRNEVAYYAINDRSAGRKVIELDLMTEAQHAELPEDEDVTAADRLIIDSPTAAGLIVMKALAPEPGLMPQAQASLAASSCKVQTEPPAKQRSTAGQALIATDHCSEILQPRELSAMSDHRLRGDRRVRGLRGEFADQSVGVGRHVVRRLQHQPFQRPAVGRDSALQALLHPLHDQGVLLHAGDRVGAFARRQFRDVRKAGVALAVEIDHAHGSGEERLEPGDVVAHVVDQLRIARGMRAVRLVDQHAPIGGAVEHHLLPPRRRQRLIIAEHALPGGARMRRLDQGIGEIAKLPFVVGELELRGLQADASRRLGADPAMHVVVEKILPGAAEIAAAAAAERHADQRTASGPMRSLEPVVWSGSENTSPACRMSDVSAGGGGGPGAVPSSGPPPPLVSLGLAFDPDDGKDQDGSHDLRAERHPWLSPAAAMPHPPEIQ